MHIRRPAVHVFALGLLMIGASSLTAQSVPVRALTPDRRIDLGAIGVDQVHAALFPKSGNIIVLTPGEYNGRVLSPDGKVIRTFARRGNGPGEIRTNVLLGAGLVADTLWIDDASNRRLSLYTADGVAVRDIPYNQPATWRNTRPEYASLGPSVAPRVLAPNGRAYGVATGSMGGAPRVGRGGDLPPNAHVPLLRMGWDRSIDTQTLVLPGQYRWFSLENRSFSQEFEHLPKYGFSDNGCRLAIASVDPRDASFVQIAHYSTEGDSIARYRIPFKADPLTTRTVDSAIAAWVAPVPQENLPPGFPPRPGLKHLEPVIRETLMIPKIFAPFRQLKLADDGTVWLWWHSPGTDRRWLVVSPRGVPTMEVELPRRTELRSINGAIWGLTWDDDDLPILVRYRIVEPGG